MQTPKEPSIEWVSIEKLLDEYSIPVLAAAIEGLNVQTHNATGRRIVATDGDENDRRSKAFALSHLADRYSMLQDPGPDDHLFDERLEIEGSPLDLFGWPKAELPDLSSINPHYSSKIKAAVTPTSSETWKITAQSLAREYLARHNAKNLHPSIKETSEHVAAAMREQKIYGPHQKPLEPSYIKRHALQADFWSNRHTY
jgi:hypothetical protein